MKTLHLKSLLLVMLLCFTGVGGMMAQKVTFTHNATKSYQANTNTSTLQFGAMHVPSSYNSSNSNSDWTKANYYNYSGEVPQGYENYQRLMRRYNDAWWFGALYDWFTLTCNTPPYTKMTYILDFRLTADKAKTNSTLRAAVYDYGEDFATWNTRMLSPSGLEYVNTTIPTATTGDEEFSVRVSGSKLSQNDPYSIFLDVVNGTASYQDYNRYFGLLSCRSLEKQNVNYAHNTYLSACVTVAFVEYVKHVVYHPNADGLEDTHAVDIVQWGNLATDIFSRNGYYIKNWNTKADGTGTTYALGQEIGVDESSKGELVLYAQWEVSRYTVTLDQQGGDGENETVQAAYGECLPAITVPTREGYTFLGYFSEPNGRGIQYYDADGISKYVWTITSNTTLYAQWVANRYTVTLDQQNGTGETETVTATYDAVMPEITLPTREGYTFCGYFSEPNGRGIQYYDADGISKHVWTITSNTTLYAQWVANRYTVTLDQQNGTGGTEVVTATYDAVMPEITLPTRGGDSFRGYFTEPDGKGTKYYNEDGTSARIWDIAANVTLYAYWALHEEIYYMGADGTRLLATDCTKINNASTTLTDGWYVVTGGNVQTGPLVCEGAVNLILADGAKLTAAGGGSSAGIQVSAEGASLTIYGQSAQSGQLIVTGGYLAAGIGGGEAGAGHDITINGGVIIAEGGEGASAIGGGYRGDTSDILVSPAVVLYADGNNPPTTLIAHAAEEDVAGKLSGKRYAIVRKPVEGIVVTFDKQGGTGGTDQITVDEGSALPAISVPIRGDYVFKGYYTKPDGAGMQYYHADGTSAAHCDFTEDLTLYAYWNGPFAYVDADGITKYVGEYDEITNETTTLSTGWYVVKGSNVQTGTLVCEGAVNLILADGAKLTATGGFGNPGIRVSAEGASLTIYGQSAQSGQLIAIGGNYGAGIGGGDNGVGHDIMINGGVITAEGGENASAIGGGRHSNSSDIFVATDFVLYADGNNPPTTLIAHAAEEDVAGKLSGKRYAIVRKPVEGIVVTFDKQGGTGGTDQITVDEGSALPAISVPIREGHVFRGYYSEPDGAGMQYYHADGTSAAYCNFAEDVILYAYWHGSLAYVDADGITKYAGEYGEITNETTTLSTGWYVVKDSNVQTGTLVCEGAVNLILADGAKLTATGGRFDAGIRVSAEGASLTIYGQTAQAGQLIALGDGYGAGIGGGDNGVGHDITINGGVITATGGWGAAGIGGGDFGAGHDITINGGVITAEGGENASAIGGGRHSNFSDIFVATDFVLYADGNNPPTTLIAHAAEEDVAGKLSGKRYAIVRKPVEGIVVTFDKQGGTGGTDQITVDEGSALPAISVPIRGDYVFKGYYTKPDGAGTKCYHADGTTAAHCDFTEDLTLYAYWNGPFAYVDADGITKYAGEYDEITNETTTLGTGWYVVKGSNVQTGTLVCEGAVNLILADGAKLTAAGGGRSAGIQVSAEGASLTIYGQTAQTGQLIALGGDYGAGIGGGDNGVGHDIMINGGVITATGGRAAAGIGGGDYAACHDITINGGVIVAEGGEYASAIGGGRRSNSSDIFVNAALILMADNDEQPTSEIEHASSDDLASVLNGKRYATMALPTVPVDYAEDKNKYYGTFYHEHASYTVTTPGVTIYTARFQAVFGTTNVSLLKVNGNVIPAGTAVVLEVKSPSDITLQPCADASGVTILQNELMGTSQPMTPSESDGCYIPGSGSKGFGFYRYSDTLPAHRAYLQLSESVQDEYLRTTITMGTSSGLDDAIEADTEDGAIYGINGVRQKVRQKGVSIIGGKKVYVK